MWEILALADGKWSVRLGGEERWLLPSSLGRREAISVERMLQALSRFRTDMTPEALLGQDERKEFTAAELEHATDKAYREGEDAGYEDAREAKDKYLADA